MVAEPAKVAVAFDCDGTYMGSFEFPSLTKAKHALKEKGAEALMWTEPNGTGYYLRGGPMGRWYKYNSATFWTEVNKWRFEAATHPSDRMNWKHGLEEGWDS